LEILYPGLAAAGPDVLIAVAGIFLKTNGKIHAAGSASAAKSGR
jgi:hypothetical protein